MRPEEYRTDTSTQCLLDNPQASEHEAALQDASWATNTQQTGAHSEGTDLARCVDPLQGAPPPRLRGPRATCTCPGAAWLISLHEDPVTDVVRMCANITGMFCARRHVRHQQPGVLLCSIMLQTKHHSSSADCDAAAPQAHTCAWRDHPGASWGANHGTPWPSRRWVRIQSNIRKGLSLLQEVRSNASAAS